VAEEEEAAEEDAVEEALDDDRGITMEDDGEIYKVSLHDAPLSNKLHQKLNCRFKFRPQIQ